MRKSYSQPVSTTPLPSGFRSYLDHKTSAIVVESTKDNPAGAGIRLCSVPAERASDVPTILAAAAMREALAPAAACAQELRKIADADPDAPLYRTLDGRHTLRVADFLRFAEVFDQAMGRSPVPALSPALARAAGPRPVSAP